MKLVRIIEELKCSLDVAADEAFSRTFSGPAGFLYFPKITFNL